MYGRGIALFRWASAASAEGRAGSVDGGGRCSDNSSNVCVVGHTPKYGHPRISFAGANPGPGGSDALVFPWHSFLLDRSDYLILCDTPALERGMETHAILSKT
ncbi:MAG: hypothetical protein J3Q66DRAFT_374070 [Benniella sp.]|nr:MAG: hypothetical protein J3Q66DRAFT_374070 [Benniella sp.]